MTPEDLETRLTTPNGPTVATVLAEVRADPDWSVTELTLAGQPEVSAMVHHPSGAAYSPSRRRGSQLRRTEGTP